MLLWYAKYTIGQVARDCNGEAGNYVENDIGDTYPLYFGCVPF